MGIEREAGTGAHGIFPTEERKLSFLMRMYSLECQRTKAFKEQVNKSAAQGVRSFTN